PGPGFLNVRPRVHPSSRFLFSRSALRHQQRFRFHHLAFHSDAGRIFGGAGSIDRGHRRVGKSLAISLGTGGGPDFDRAPLVFVGTWHVRGDVADSCASSAPSKRRRRFDDSCFYFASYVRVVANETLGERMRILWRDILSMVRVAIPLFTIMLVCSPIGAGAMNNLWSAVAPDWRATPDQVALVSGVLNGVLSAIGCVIGGWVADRVGRWWAYFGSGILIAMVAIIMAV